MRARATTKSAAITGAYCSLVAFVFGPLVDKPSSASSVWLVVVTLAVALPAYFFVFGIRREEMVGLWVLQPALLKRVAACLVGAIAVATVAQGIILLTSGVAP